MSLPKGVFIIGNIMDAPGQTILGHVPSASMGDRKKA
jgi:hypothetical protein